MKKGLHGLKTTVKAVRQNKPFFLLKLNNSTTQLLGWSTLLGFSIGGAAWIYFFHPSFSLATILGPSPWILQLLVGAGYGSLSALVAWKLIQSQLLDGIRDRYSTLFQKLNLTTFDAFFLSFCAGFGEEIFFRAAMQPSFGLWTTSILFVALHGYLDPRSWRMSVYGTVMVFIIAGMGYLFETMGLLTAIMAHFTIDAILLLIIVKQGNNSSN